MLDSSNASWHDYDVQRTQKNHISSTSHGVYDTAVDLIVTESDTPANTVKVGTGKAWVNINKNSQDYSVEFSVETAEDIVITSNISGNPRIDLVIARVDTTTDPDATSSNVGLLEVVAGTPAGSPTAPSCPANAIPLATVAVANGQTTFVDADITDARQEYYYEGLRAAGGGTGKDVATIDDIQVDASSTVQGTTKLSTNPAVATEPIAVGDNDTRMLTTGEKALLIGSLDASPVITVPQGNYQYAQAYDWGGNYNSFPTTSSVAACLSVSPNGGATSVFDITYTYEEDGLGVGSFFSSGSWNAWACVGMNVGIRGSEASRVKARVLIGQTTNSTGYSNSPAAIGYIFDTVSNTWINTASAPGVTESTSASGLWKVIEVDYATASKYIDESGVIGIGVQTSSTGYHSALIDFAEASAIDASVVYSDSQYIFLNSKGTAAVFDGDLHGTTEQVSAIGASLARTSIAPLWASGFDTGDTNEYYSKATTTDYVTAGTTPATIIGESANTDEANLTARNGLTSNKSASNSSEYAYQLFEFDTSSHDYTEFNRIDIAIAASGGGTNLDNGYQLYGWNFTDSQWDLIITDTEEYDTYGLQSTRITDVSKYADVNDKVYLLLRATDVSDGVDSISIKTDYVEILIYSQLNVQTAGVVDGFSGLEVGKTHFPAFTSTSTDVVQKGATLVKTSEDGTTIGNGNAWYATRLTDSNFQGYVESLTIESKKVGTNELHLELVKAEVTTPSTSTAQRFGAAIKSWKLPYVAGTATEYKLEVKRLLTGTYWLVARSSVVTSGIYHRITNNASAGNNVGYYLNAATGTFTENDSYSMWCRMDGVRLLPATTGTSLSTASYNLALKPVGTAISPTSIKLRNGSDDIPYASGTANFLLGTTNSYLTQYPTYYVHLGFKPTKIEASWYYNQTSATQRGIYAFNGWGWNHTEAASTGSLTASMGNIIIGDEGFTLYGNSVSTYIWQVQQWRAWG